MLCPIVSSTDGIAEKTIERLRVALANAVLPEMRVALRQLSITEKTQGTRVSDIA